jgi:hypothetical protein
MNFATQPLIIIEGLVNGHNDLIGLSLAVIGVYWVLKKKNVLGRCLLVLSAGIKYLTLPFVVLGRNKYLNWFSLAGALIILGYLSLYNEVQPWYFLMLFVFLPINEAWLSKLNIFLIGLLLSYYPYIDLGGWADKQNVLLKHQIIMVGLGLNLLSISWVYWKKKFFIK